MRRADRGLHACVSRAMLLVLFVPRVVSLSERGCAFKGDGEEGARWIEPAAALSLMFLKHDSMAFVLRAPRNLGSARSSSRRWN